MKRSPHLLITGALACGLALGLCTDAAAQKPGHAAARPGRPTAQSNETKTQDAGQFKGIAAKLGTTPEALETAYEAAKLANPGLTHGQFVAANVVAHNLSTKNPSITTQAILDGLKSGKSIGQTLQSLGLSDKDAKAAEQAANKEAKDVE